jgi:tetratricopeptide (TPR) repeat protein
MEIPRAVAFSVVLLLTVGCFTDVASAQTTWLPRDTGTTQTQIPCESENSISHEVVAMRRFQQWTVDFDYCFTGAPNSAELVLELTPEAAPALAGEMPNALMTLVGMAEPGMHHLSAPIRYMGNRQRTSRLSVSLHSGFVPVGAIISPATVGPVLAHQEILQSIDWPDPLTARRNYELATHSVDESLRKAQALIDTEAEQNELEARAILEALIADNPRLDPAFTELARVAMRTDWSPAGRHHAEELLQSSLRINPQSVNAKILLGYVYAHEHQYAKAEALFSDAAKVNTNNLWLWSNWGELLVMEGKRDQAIAKYRKAISEPMTHDTYDRAKTFAYRNLIDLLSERSDLDGMEALYRQQIQEFGPGTCYSGDYTKFLLYVRDNAQSAIDLATRALNQNCNDAASREVLGLAQYVKWATTVGPQSEDALNQAHLFLSAGPRAFYGLAISEYSFAAARKLVVEGEKIDEPDKDEMTALAYALQDHDLAAAARLLKLGANPEAIVGDTRMPIALMSVAQDDVGAVKLLRKWGVDFSKIKFRGMSALDLAQRSGDRALLDAIGSRGPQI